MGRQFSLIAEIFEGFHDPCAEKCLPMPIHRNSSSERVLRIDQPAGKGQSIIPLNRRQDGGHMRTDGGLEAGETRRDDANAWGEDSRVVVLETPAW
ncbi:MAG: hypothetical protein KatS3mg114_0351 [Planctomycetaceae bacterium]|nr:MAG: hypothetical protein KatS3mg114_0351 [Planctomycetaceae bacterium]